MAKGKKTRAGFTSVWCFWRGVSYLPRLLAMATLHDTAERAGDVTFAGRGAVLVVLLVAGSRGAADVHLTWRRRMIN